MKLFYSKGVPWDKTILALSFYFSCCLLNVVYGQGENNTWYFGYHTGLDFNSGNPVVITNGQTSVREGTATISDSTGNLLFYTDGVSVWNRNHIVMPNGTGLFGHPSTTQSATIVPMPGSNTQYYIFTAPEHSIPADFSYSIVDMTLDGGDGDITVKNTGLHSNSSEKCVAVYKTGAPDVWVIGASSDSIFYAYLVTASGINPAVLSFHQPFTGSYGFDIGYMKASPQGNKIAAAVYLGTAALLLFDFDCTNGNISNEMAIPISGTLYGLEFSPDGSKLYVWPWAGSPTPIYQYDVTLPTAAAIAASQITVGNANHHDVGGGQIGPDQKIYISIDYGDYLLAINNPNMQGAACNFVDNAIYLGGDTSGIGLPALIRGSICNTTSITETPNDLEEFQLFPNPSNGIFQINFSKVSPDSYRDGKVSCEVINTLGQTVFSSDLRLPTSDLQTNLDVSFLPKGIYVLMINDGAAAFSSKFVIE